MLLAAFHPFPRNTRASLGIKHMTLYVLIILSSGESMSLLKRIKFKSTFPHSHLTLNKMHFTHIKGKWDEPFKQDEYCYHFCPGSFRNAGHVPRRQKLLRDDWLLRCSGLLCDGALCKSPLLVLERKSCLFKKKTLFCIRFLAPS